MEAVSVCCRCLVEHEDTQVVVYEDTYIVSTYTYKVAYKDTYIVYA